MKPLVHRLIAPLLLLTGLLTGAHTTNAQTPAATTTPGGSPVQLSAVARARLSTQMAAVAQERESQTPAQRKIASSLRYAAKEQATAAPAVAGAPKLRSAAVLEADGRLSVKIKADVTPELLASIKALGGTVTGTYPGYRVVYATVPLGNLETLAAHPEVEFIDVPPKADLNRPRKPQAAAGQAAVPLPAADSSPNDPEGDAVHGTAIVRSQYGATGAGIKVAVISDTIDNAQGSYQNALLNGYVSAVTIVPGQAGDSATGEAEGLAMLETVHRMVPGAQLYFATATTGEEQMATNINTLVADGCNVIIDDFAFADEPPFQDNAIAQAYNAASAKGVLCFSCSANFGNQDGGYASCWEGDFKPVTGSNILDFQPGSGAELNYVGSVSGEGASVSVYLFWSEPLGAATSVYTLYETDSEGDLIQSATNNGKDPIQHIDNVTAGDYIAIEKTSGSDRFLHVDCASQGAGFQYTTAGRTRGHDANGAPNHFTVAAAPAAAADTNFQGSPTGPYPNLFSAGDKVELFSNDGPRRIFFYPDGSAITPGNFSSTGGQQLAKPDFTAADGVTTSLPAGGGLNPFFGTSCAAPHAGAIAALLLSYKPTLTPAQVGAALRGGSVQITNPGSGNRDSGSGILLAPNIFQAANTPPSILSFSPANGPAGTLVTVTGINLGTAVTAAVNGVAATVTVANSNTLTVMVPAGATTGPITVQTAGGTASSASNFMLTASVSTPVVSSATAASGQVGHAFSYQITATNGPTSYGAAGLPAGLTVNEASGLISGLPTVAGTFAATVSAGNAAGGSSSSVLTLTILPGAPVVTSATAATGQQNAAFAFQVTATNGPTSFAAQGLPAGLGIDPADGLISGTPTAPGTFTVTVSAGNAGGANSSLLTLTILPLAPAVTSAAAANGQVGVAFAYQIAAINGPTSFAATGLPGGLTLAPASGLISGTPTVPGTFQVTVTAANAGGAGGAVVTLTILPAVPVITSTPTANAQQTVPFTYGITASSAPTSFAATGLPAGLSLNATTGVISGTPTTPGTYMVALAAANAGGTGKATLTLTVAAPPEPTVTLTIPAPSVTINSGAIGEFLLTLSAVQTQDVIVAYTVKGTGGNGTDYVFLKGTAKIKAGKTSKPIKVTPQGTLGGASKKTVKLTLGAGNGYLLGGTVTGKVKILAGQ